MSSFAVISQPRAIRLRLGLNQQEFWGRVGVTQSGGSRYESGRNMPKPVRELVRLVYIEQIDLSVVTRCDIEMIAMLKEKHPEQYKSLRKTVQARMAAVKSTEQPT
ncbi:helix-turn-helix domain-containing protein [Chromobacterium haemolyticum]|uniref:helix-turn-helix domain-containing protein n=1 Tax=Chromobacterium haemolyticum TaxID=394935 RepID=UPI001317A2A2|nr:transcriptional regulator [Chromobacterium haemolyticum]BBH12873.1 transcriptional regulator [Chromobacterium haemolyticum]